MGKTVKTIHFRATQEDLGRLELITAYLEAARPDAKPETTATMRFVLAQVAAWIREMPAQTWSGITGSDHTV